MPVPGKFPDALEGGKPQLSKRVSRPSGSRGQEEFALGRSVSLASGQPCEAIRLMKG